MWYNPVTGGGPVSDKPGAEICDPAYWNELYGDWVEVGADFVRPRFVAEERVKKMNELYAAFCAARDAVVWVGGKGYDSNVGDLPNFLASQKRADLKGESYYKVYTDQADLAQKEFLPHTPAMFGAALLAGGDQQEAAHVRFGVKRASVMAATTIAEIDAVKWEVG